MGILSRTCELTGRQFFVSEMEQDFCTRSQLPLPTQHPFERLRNLLVFRNRPHLYNSVCDFSGKKIFSCIRPERGHQVYDVDIWESDKWDALSYGRPYDFARPFFEQFAELYRSVPLPNLAVSRSTMENSDFTNGITGAKNCYLVFGASYNEDCMYSYCINNCRTVLDCAVTDHAELCYSCLNCTHCYNVRYAQNCHHCSDCAFVFSCQSCRNCFGCVNLSSKEYHFFNEKLSPDEYQRRLSSLDLGSNKVVSGLKQQFEEYALQFPLKNLWGKLNEDSSGNNLNQTRRCKNSFYCYESEDLEYCVWINRGRSSLFHCTYGNDSELIYNSVCCGDNAYNLSFCIDCWPGVQNLEYCAFTGQGSANCFGCVGLRKKSYCILNRQYSKEEYFSLLKRIKAHMLQTGEYGRFFPPQLSPHAYNSSDVAHFLPLSKEEALKLGFCWDDAEPASENKVSPPPDHIKDLSAEMIASPFLCALSKKPFKILKQELDFYKQMNIPPPNVAPLHRIFDLGKAIEISSVRTTTCNNCHITLETAHSTKHSQVLCESCFQQTCAEA